MATDRKGLILTLGAFVIWGISPIFWKFLLSVPATQLLAHRVLWAAVVLLLLLALQRRWAEVRAMVSSRRVMLTLFATTLLIAVNWLTYIWAVATERILHASLGYYINPLVTVLLAMVFLGERLSRTQWLSLALATIGVTVMVVSRGELPWISLTLAGTFGLYGLLRKQVRAEAEVGLALETSLLLPFVLLFLLREDFLGAGAFGHSGPAINLLLICSGIITALPLLLVIHGARRLPLATVGMLQFAAPTLQFMVAVLVFHEPFPRTEMICFSFIWTAVALFTWDASTDRRAAQTAPGSIP